MPFVSGHVEIHVGDNVRFGGKVSILSGGGFEEPKFVVRDRSMVGWNTIITVSKEVIIEEDVIVSYDCRISDTDGHRKEADLRAAGVRPDLKASRPVRIGRYAFIGNGAHIMKGVTIGEGATVGSNSVVMSNVPPYSLAVEIRRKFCSETTGYLRLRRNRLRRTQKSAISEPYSLRPQRV
jgi:acetyltransferase-like isoleucine patch superfamily enzyme